MTVSIHIEANNAFEAREQMEWLLGAKNVPTPPPMRDDEFEKVPEPEPEQAQEPEQEPETTTEPDPEPAARIYGQSENGRGRRTKAQIAEDEEIENLASDLGIDKADFAGKEADKVLTKLKQMALEAEHSADDTRTIAPESEPEEDPEQDVEPTPPAAEGTRDDVRAAMQRYVEKFGMDKAQSALPEVMGYEKQSQIPEDPAEFAKVAAKIDEAVADG